MRQTILGFALIASACTASPAAPPAQAPPAAIALGGGGGGAAGGIAAGGGGAVGAVDRPPGARTTTAACPIAFAAELQAAIATVEDRGAHDALEVQRLLIDRLPGASLSARLSAVSRLQALAQRLELHGDLPADAAARIADLAPCYLE